MINIAIDCSLLYDTDWKIILADITLFLGKVDVSKVDEMLTITSTVNKVGMWDFFNNNIATRKTFKYVDASVSIDGDTTYYTAKQETTRR